MSSGKAGTPARQMSEQQALALLRKYDRVQWVGTVASSIFAGLLMFMVRMLLFDENFESAAFYAVLFTVFMSLTFILFDWVRARRVPDGASTWESLERATVVSRQGNEVTIKGRRHTVVAPAHNAWTLNEGESLWVGPAVREGERMALVRAAAGPFGTTVYSASGPARSV